MGDVCPWCSNPLELTARKPGGKSTSTRTTAEWLGEVIRNMFRPRGYKTTGTAPTYTQPVVNVPPEPQSSIGTSELQRGETRTSTRYRPKTARDLLFFLVWSTVAATGTYLFMWGIAEESPQTSAGVAGGILFVMFLASSRKLVWDGEVSIVTMLEKLTRTDLNGDGQIGDITLNLDADLPGTGTGMHKTRVSLPLTQARNWRRFCQDVLAGECRFSGNAAEDHGLDRAWFDGLVQQWAGNDPSRALIKPESVGDRKTPKLTDLGWERIERDAHTPLPALVSHLEQITGTDRQ